MTKDLIKLLDEHLEQVTEYFDEIKETKTKKQLIAEWNQFEYKSLLPGGFGGKRSAGIFENQVANKRDEYGLILFAEVLNKLLAASKKA